jgi:hypothetical protein
MSESAVDIVRRLSAIPLLSLPKMSRISRLLIAQ